ncbi:MAG: cysteine--tRNA ligase [Candidatus Pacebacteria bacterium]|nr:cysteine--tRNA ligase [Candidatus Paceibacterota bacterium]
MKIYNTLTREKEDFIPLEDGMVKMYACGVTPYDEMHIGHARQAVVYDLMRRYFEYSKYNVKYVRNFTDIDDKIIKKANDQERESREISEHYIQESYTDLEKLKVKRATYEPKVSECIVDIINYIQVLIDKEFAYIANGEVIFSIDKFSEYGKLSNRKKEDLINTEESTNKKNQNDFVLWKPSKPGEPSWDSPWSKGRPGWHIECSVMANKHLGEQVDIHGGGLDLIFPHHENEIAQSEAYSGKQFAKYWIHNGLVMVDGVKMSKSLGNFLTVKDALEEYFPEEIRYAILTHNYNSDIDFSKELFLNARKRMAYFYTTLDKINNLKEGSNEPPILFHLKDKFKEYMDDNFSTPKVIAEISEVFKELNKLIQSNKYSQLTIDEFLKEFKEISSVLDLFNEDPRQYLDKLKKKVLDIDDSFISQKIEEYENAKNSKDYSRVDEIRAELKEKKISIQDKPDSITWEIIF